MALPVWLAAIVHVPPPTIVTVEPDTVQTDVVAELNADTASPTELVAETVNGAAPNVLPDIAGTVRVCAPCPTVNEVATCGAAR